jgi:hypothetical protein
MSLISAILLAAAIHAVMASPIFWVKEEPYKLQVLLASTLRGGLVGLLIAFTIQPGSAWWSGLGYGVLYGLLTGLVVWLASGGWASKGKPFILISSVVTGGITGAILALL